MTNRESLERCQADAVSSSESRSLSHPVFSFGFGGFRYADLDGLKQRLQPGPSRLNLPAQHFLGQTRAALANALRGDELRQLLGRDMDRLVRFGHVRDAQEQCSIRTSPI